MKKMTNIFSHQGSVNSNPLCVLSSLLLVRPDGMETHRSGVEMTVYTARKAGSTTY